MVLKSFPRQAFLWILTNQSLSVVRCSFITHLRRLSMKGHLQPDIYSITKQILHETTKCSFL